MGIRVIQAERTLVNALRQHERQTLGPDATDEEVETATMEAYYGPAPTRRVTPTAEQIERRRTAMQETLELIDEWNNA